MNISVLFFIIIVVLMFQKIATQSREIEDERKYIDLLNRHENTLKEMLDIEEDLNEKKKYIRILEEKIEVIGNKKKNINFLKRGGVTKNEQRR